MKLWQSRQALAEANLMTTLAIERIAEAPHVCVVELGATTWSWAGKTVPVSFKTTELISSDILQDDIEAGLDRMGHDFAALCLRARAEFTDSVPYLRRNIDGEHILDVNPQRTAELAGAFKPMRHGTYTEPLTTAPPSDGSFTKQIAKMISSAHEHLAIKFRDKLHNPSGRWIYGAALKADFSHGQRVDNDNQQVDFLLQDITESFASGKISDRSAEIGALFAAHLTGNAPLPEGYLYQDPQEMIASYEDADPSP